MAAQPYLGIIAHFGGILNGATDPRRIALRYRHSTYPRRRMTAIALSLPPDALFDYASLYTRAAVSWNSAAFSLVEKSATMRLNEFHITL